MAEPNTIYKMTVLELLNRVDFPLTNTQISNFFLEEDYTDYFTVQQIISGLLDSGLIRAESTHSNTQYFLTDEGKQTLEFLGDKITPAIQQDIAEYFEKNKITLREENSVFADFYRSSGGGFDVRCQLKEKESTLIDLTVHVSNEVQARAVCGNWNDHTMDIYAYLMDTLIR